MIPTLKQWLDGTARGLMATRGERLKALDRAIGDYHTARSAKTREAVGEAWTKWKANHPEFFGPKGSNRNKSAMLDLLEAEFSPEGLDKITNCSMSRIKVSFQSKPVGFPAVADAIAADRIDKALIDAQGVLRMTTRRLERGDSSTKENAKLWFDTKSLGDLQKRFQKLLDHVETKLKRNEVPLEIRWCADADNLASTGFGQNHLSFGPGFFDDKVTVPSWSLAGKPMPEPDYLIKAKAVVAEWDKLKNDEKLLTSLGLWLKAPGSTVEECIKNYLKKASFPDFPTAGACLKAIAPLGFGGGDERDAVKARIERQLAANTARAAEMMEEHKSRKLAVSASGVIVHELTHMVLNTEDVQSPLFTAKMACYGPGLCLHLASVKPKDAFNNADNYRLFAECCQFD